MLTTCYLTVECNAVRFIDIDSLKLQLSFDKSSSDMQLRYLSIFVFVSCHLPSIEALTGTIFNDCHHNFQRFDLTLTEQRSFTTK